MGGLRSSELARVLGGMGDGSGPNSVVPERSVRPSTVGGRWDIEEAVFKGHNASRMRPLKAETFRYDPPIRGT